MTTKSGGTTRGWVFLLSLLLMAGVFTQLKALLG